MRSECWIDFYADPKRGWLAGCGSGNANEPIEALATLPLTILRHESGVGAEIARKFVAFCRAWSGTERDGMTFIVTTGYSRTVAESVATAVESHPSFRAFLLTDHEPEQMSARLMKVQVQLRHAGNAGTMKQYEGGPAAMLLGLLKRGDRLVLLLGAECCDGDGRVAHPRLLDQDVRRVVASARRRGAHVDVVVVAAHYKMVAGRLAASRFYADHFDGVTVLGEPLVTTLITEKRVGSASGVVGLAIHGFRSREGDRRVGRHDARQRLAGADQVAGGVEEPSSSTGAPRPPSVLGLTGLVYFAGALALSLAFLVATGPVRRGAHRPGGTAAAPCLGALPAGDHGGDAARPRGVAAPVAARRLLSSLIAPSRLS